MIGIFSEKQILLLQKYEETSGGLVLTSLSKNSNGSNFRLNRQKNFSTVYGAGGVFHDRVENNNNISTNNNNNNKISEDEYGNFFTGGHNNNNTFSPQQKRNSLLGGGGQQQQHRRKLSNASNPFTSDEAVMMATLRASSQPIFASFDGNKVIAIFPEGKFKIIEIGKKTESFDCARNVSSVCILPNNHNATKEFLLFLGTDEGEASKICVIRLWLQSESFSTFNVSSSQWSVPGGVSCMSHFCLENENRIMISFSSVGGMHILDPSGCMKKEESVNNNNNNDDDDDDDDDDKKGEDEEEKGRGRLHHHSQGGTSSLVSQSRSSMFLPDNGEPILSHLLIVSPTISAELSQTSNEVYLVTCTLSGSVSFYLIVKTELTSLSPITFTPILLWKRTLGPFLDFFPVLPLQLCENFLCVCNWNGKFCVIDVVSQDIAFFETILAGGGGDARRRVKNMKFGMLEGDLVIVQEDVNRDVFCFSAMKAAVSGSCVDGNGDGIKLLDFNALKEKKLVASSEGRTTNTMEEEEEDFYFGNNNNTKNKSQQIPHLRSSSPFTVTNLKTISEEVDQLNLLNALNFAFLNQVPTSNNNNNTPYYHTNRGI